MKNYNAIIVICDDLYYSNEPIPEDTDFVINPIAWKSPWLECGSDIAMKEYSNESEKSKTKFLTVNNFNRNFPGGAYFFDNGELKLELKLELKIGEEGFIIIEI